MSARLLEHNEHFNLLSGKGKLGFLGIGDAAEAQRKAQNLAEAQVKYPFPPKSCGDAALKIAQLDAAIKAQQEILATQGDSRVARRWIETFTIVQEEFKQWTLVRKCEEQQTQASDQAFYDQLNTTI